MRPWRFVVLWIALFSVALSTGVELLSYLSYLVLFVAAAMWILSKMTLEGLSVKRAIGQTYAHLGDTIVLTGQRSLQSTSMVMGIREYRPGDAMNRIHWPSSVRHRRLHVKEFELDKTADLWLYLDLDERWHSGEGEDSSEERCVTVAASVVAKALREHRNVGLITTGNRADVLHPDRGNKQYGKLMQYLADIHAGGTLSLAETLVETLPRLRRGASCLLITPSLDRAWVRPASTLRETSIATQAGVVSPPVDIDERDRARRHAILGELAVAGIPVAHLAAGAPIEELFHQSGSAVA